MFSSFCTKAKSKALLFVFVCENYQRQEKNCLYKILYLLTNTIFIN